MAEVSSLDGSRAQMVETFLRIPGLGRSRAEAIYDAGYTNMGLLKKAGMDELTRIPGVGISLARCIMNNVGSVKEEHPAEVTVGPAEGAPTQSTGGEGGKGVVAASPGPATPAGPAKPPAAASAAGPQPKSFLSSLFGKILGKPDAPPAERQPSIQPSEKKEGTAGEGKAAESTWEKAKGTAPPEKTGEGVKIEGTPEEAPKEGVKAEAAQGAAGGGQEAAKTADKPIEGAKVEGASGDDGVKVEGKA